MTFYLISLALIGALILATWRVARMHREIRVLRAHHAEFERSLTDATLALAKVGRLIDGIYGEGGHVLLELGMRIEEGRELAARLQELSVRRDAAAPRATAEVAAGGHAGRASALVRFPDH
jgi:hypothetical protein